MATVFVGARIPPSLNDKLSEYLDRVGASKSEILTAALAQYLGATEDLPLSQRMVELEQRMTALEIRLEGKKQRLKPSERPKKRGRNNERSPKASRSQQSSGTAL